MLEKLASDKHTSLFSDEDKSFETPSPGANVIKLYGRKLQLFVKS
jgi:hypothetical protein